MVRNIDRTICPQNWSGDKQRQDLHQAEPQLQTKNIFANRFANSVD